MIANRIIRAALYLFLLGVFFFGSPYLFGLTETGLTLLLIAFSMGLLSYFMATGKRDFFEPLVIFAFTNVRFLSRPLYLAITGEPSTLVTPFFTPEESIRHTNWVLTLNLLGIISYLAGYYSKLSSYVSKKIPHYPHKWSKKRLKKIVLVYAIIGVSSFIAVMWMNGGPKYILEHLYQRRTLFAGKHYFIWGSTLIAISFLVYASYIMAKIKRGILFVPPLIAISLIYFLFGGRGTVLSIIALFTMIYHYLVKRLGFGILLTICIGLILLAIVLGEFRAKTAGYSILKDREDVSVVDMFEAYLRTATYFDSAILAVKGVDEGLIPLQYGKTYLGLLANPIPRALWPEKPSSSEDKIVGDAYFGPNTVEYHTPCGFVGTTYMNFGVSGILLGFWLLGIFHKGLYNYMMFDRHNPSNVLIYVISIWSIQIGFPNIAVMSWIMYLFPIAIALRYIGGRRGVHSSVRQYPDGKDYLKAS